MAGTTLDFETLLQPEDLAHSISRHWHEWNNYRQDWIKEKEEVRQYLYATDTTKTAGSHLPWRNTTHIPKLTQIRDNLLANYMAALFPRRDWMVWEGDDEESDEPDKAIMIQEYMKNAINKGGFISTIENLLGDYLDYGKCFVTPAWQDRRTNTNKHGWVGPVAKRISPLDIVFNPTAPTFLDSPKIIREVVTLGELKKRIEMITNDQSREIAEEAFNYITETRKQAASHQGGYNFSSLDDLYQVSGLSSWQDHVGSDYVELLHFYGDIYDKDSGELLRNYEIVIADKDKVLVKREDVTFFDTIPIYSAGWRKRQDNLWDMGPFDNLIGMQYRINHLENAKADMVDLTVVPPLKIKGHLVDDFTWGPFEKIFVGDDGDVEVMQINNQAITIDTQIERYIQLMEAMAGAPREAMGFRTPGEKTKYEVQRLENAASRIFQAKITQFENEILEPVLNAMLELARRNLTSETIRVEDKDLGIATFIDDLTPADITGAGKLRPVGAKHFAEKAAVIQDINGFFSSAVGQDPEVISHMSSWRLAKMFEDLLDIKQFDVVQKNVRLSERSETQLEQNVMTEQMGDTLVTPSGLRPDDSTESFLEE